jgi:hypothetical protein
VALVEVDVIWKKWQKINFVFMFGEVLLQYDLGGTKNIKAVVTA